MREAQDVYLLVGKWSTEVCVQLARRGATESRSRRSVLTTTVQTALIRQTSAAAATATAVTVTTTDEAAAARQLVEDVLLRARISRELRAIEVLRVDALAVQYAAHRKRLVGGPVAAAAAAAGAVVRHGGHAQRRRRLLLAAIQNGKVKAG